MEKGIARIEPAKRGQNRQCSRSDLLANVGKKLVGRRDALRADESVDLDPKRNERDQVNKTEPTQEPAARPKVGWRPHIFAPEESRHGRCAAAIARNQTVKRFRCRGETR